MFIQHICIIIHDTYNILEAPVSLKELFVIKDLNLKLCCLIQGNIQVKIQNTMDFLIQNNCSKCLYTNYLYMY